MLAITRSAKDDLPSCSQYKSLISLGTEELYTATLIDIIKANVIIKNKKSFLT